MRFENGLKAEMAPTDHAAMMRFTYPGDDASVIFDNVTDQAGLTLDKENGTFQGYSDVKSGLSTGATRLFVHGEFDAEVTGGDSSGVKGHLRFDAGKDRTVTLRIATSLISVDQAKDNLRQEIPARASFDKVKRDAQRQWDRILGKVEVEGATRDQLTTLYSSLYRLYLYPNAGHEKVDGTYKYASPFSKAVKEDTRRRPAPRSSTARSTSTTASGTRTGPPGPRTPSSPRPRPVSWSTASCSTTRTAAGPPAGPPPATRT